MVRFRFFTLVGHGEAGGYLPDCGKESPVPDLPTVRATLRHSAGVVGQLIKTNNNVVFTGVFPLPGRGFPGARFCGPEV